METVALLSKLDVDKHIDVEIKLDELDLTFAEIKATYAKIMVDRFSSRIYNPKLLPVKMNSIVVS